MFDLIISLIALTVAYGLAKALFGTDAEDAE